MTQTETFQNLFIRYINMQDGHDLIIVRKADAEELIAVIEEMAHPSGLSAQCVRVGCVVLLSGEIIHGDWCLCKRAETLLARMGKGVTGE